MTTLFQTVLLLSQTNFRLNLKILEFVHHLYYDRISCTFGQIQILLVWVHLIFIYEHKTT